MKKLLISIIKLIKRIQKAMHRKPVILIYSLSTTMDEHVFLYYNAVKNQNYKFRFIFWNCGKIDKTKYKKFNLDKHLIIKNKFAYLLSNPDLIVTADLFVKYLKIFPTKTLYLNHGASTICWNNNQNTCYSYHPEKPIFDIYFETSKLIYENKNEILNYSDKIVFAGNKHSDKFAELINQQEHFKKQLGINLRQKTIFIVGSWNKHSLFHKLGKNLLSEIKRLAQNESLKFIVSIHPKEYENYDENIEPLGKFIDELENYNVIVRKPGSDMMPYLIASDLIISDFTAMTDNAIMAEKDIIYSDFDTSNLYKYSSVYRLKNTLPTISNPFDLEKFVLMNYPKKYKKEILKIKEEMTTPNGFYTNLCINTTKNLLNKSKAK